MSNKDLKAIAEETIAEAKERELTKDKNLQILNESLAFFEDYGVDISFDDSQLRISFRQTSFLWDVFALNTPYMYEVWAIKYNRRHKTLCDSVEKLVRLIANYSVTRDLEQSAIAAGVEWSWL